MKLFTIAIDGPSGVGKSTLANKLAEELHIHHLDTGAMYRCLGLACLKAGLDPSLPEDADEVLATNNLQIAFQDNHQLNLLNGHDVSDEIRNDAVSMAASTISKHPHVRSYLTLLQRELAKTASFVLDGRDIGTVVLPKATVKIFLTADAKKRAERRYLELKSKGQEIDLATVEEDLRRRDKQDSERKVAPLCRAEDAHLIDSTNLDIEGTVKAVLDLCAKRGIQVERR